MFTAHAGSGRAKPALWIALLSLAAALAGCSANTGTSALEVEVVLEAGLISRCVKVTATDGTIARESKPIALDMKMSPLHIAVYADGFAQPVTLQALGYSDDGCTTRTGEASEQKEGTFTSPLSTVTLTLRPVATGDGGADAGTDAGADAGLDAGLDLDLDGYPQPADCDDTNAAINPGAAEVCRNGLDDDCDNLRDCEQTSCNGSTCAGNGTCMANVCVSLTEQCNDGVDNNGNGLVDCADIADCPLNTICTDGNPCTLGDRCVADGGCEKVGDTVCNSPPAAQCWAAAGVCLPDAGPMCQYTPMAGACSDGLGCTTGDTCTGGSCTSTGTVACASPPNSCFQPAGTCQEPLGDCTYAPRPAGDGTCSDGQNCTINDTCAGDGGCAGTQVVCPAPTQCQNASTGCDLGGACIFPPRTDLACDAGTGAGTCDSAAACVPNPTSIFATPPSNFLESQLPDAGTAFTVSCNTVLSTSGTPAITDGGCVTMPPHATITQTTGNEPAVLIRLTNLTVNVGQTLTIVGTRPVIFAVTGNVQISGTIRAANPAAPLTCGIGGNGTGKGGGGGAGHGTAGRIGGTSDNGSAGGPGALNGSATLIPLRGGCSGGNGGGTGGTGGAGGGSLQIVATGTISIASTAIITAPGRGGLGATGNDDGGGGGGSGGAILLEAPTITMTGAAKLTANGGAGGSGDNNGTDGNPGNPGNEATATGATGGTQGSAGSGGTGGASAIPGVGGNSGDDGAGGAGGAVGRIRINSPACTVTTGEVISPAHTGATCT